MKIQITAKSGITTKQGKFKPYQEFDLDFHDFDQDRPKKKHLVSFTSQKLFDKLVEAGIGSTWEITTKPSKDPQYVDWVDATPAFDDVGTPAVAALLDATPDKLAGGPKPAASGYSVPANSIPQVPHKSTYETPEERAKKQVYIVRQRSISNAIAFTNNNLTALPEGVTVEELLDVARKFENYVFGIAEPEVLTVD